MNSSPLSDKDQLKSVAVFQTLGIKNTIREESMTEKSDAGVRTVVRKWGFVGLMLPILFLGWWCYHDPCGFLTRILLRNYPTFFILPYGAFFAYFLVVTLEHSRGPIEAELMGLKFKGAAGPIVFWLLIFLALLLALKLLWIQPPGDFVCSPETAAKLSH